MSNIDKSAVELLSDLRCQKVTAVDLLEETIEHAERVSALVNPFALKLYDQAREKAKAADQLLAKQQGGPLCGLPITIKDSQWYAGVPCANGSKTMTDFIPESTCESVQRLEDAGAVIFAKTTCPEFSLCGVTESDLCGITSNPWDHRRVSGGSSGGAGAAVAAGAGSLSLGGDGGGSIRIPAAFCGIVGFKPSFNAVPRDNSFPSWKSLVSYGPMTRSVVDARMMYSVLVDNHQDHAFKDNFEDHPHGTFDLKGKRIIVSEDLGGVVPIDDDVRQAFQTTINLLEQAGAELIYDQPTLPSSVIAWVTIAHYDSWHFQSQKPAPLEGLEERTFGMMSFGASLTEEQYQAAEMHRKQIEAAYSAMFDRADSSVFMTPTMGCEAFPVGHRHPGYIGNTPIEYPWLDWAGFLYDANLTGMPALTLPMGLGDQNMPMSIQITGPKATDAMILDVAEQLETLIDWDSSPKI